jgi:hypothetical protein
VASRHPPRGCHPAATAGCRALLVLLLMLGTNAWLWWRSVQAFSADPGYGGSSTSCNPVSTRGRTGIWAVPSG